MSLGNSLFSARKKSGLSQKLILQKYADEHHFFNTRFFVDDDLSGPSASIQNQRELLCRYCEEQGWRVAGIFQDDGYSGASFVEVR